MADAAPGDIADDSTDPPPLDQTALHSLHVELGARLVPFAGWEMPIQYEGVKAEHLHTRAAAGLFDVGHMGVVEFHGNADRVAVALESVMPTLLASMQPGRQRYTFLTNDHGGVIDDLMIARPLAGPAFVAVFNAANVEVDLAHLHERLAADVASGDLRIDLRRDLSIIALQGPEAVAAATRLAPAVDEMSFMDVIATQMTDATVQVSRSGYTGEDGVEIICPSEAAEAIARSLLSDERVAPIGLGARDTLRLEAGLCLHGQDLSATITPIEADLKWAIPKRRRDGGGYPGADVVARQSTDGPPRLRVGLLPDRRPVRADSALRTTDGQPVGIVTSGGFGPSVDAPIAMGLIEPQSADGVGLTELGTQLIADVRGRDEIVTVASLPFSPHRYQR